MSAKFKKYAALLLLLTAIFSLTIVSSAGTYSTQYAASKGNFRNVKTGKIGRNNLYRSQHPANGSKRAVYANLLAKNNKVRVIINLSDSKSQLKKYFKKYNLGTNCFYRRVYNAGRVYAAHMSETHNGSTYRKKVAKSLRFMSKNKGPYLIHCQVGRDRTGFVIMLLECLMGGSYDYMVQDYAKSLVNVNKYSTKKARTKAISAINSELHYLTGKSKKTNWRKINLANYAVKYLKKGGMSTKEITALKKNLSISYPNP